MESEQTGIMTHEKDSVGGSPVVRPGRCRFQPAGFLRSVFVVGVSAFFIFSVVAWFQVASTVDDFCYVASGCPEAKSPPAGVRGRQTASCTNGAPPPGCTCVAAVEHDWLVQAGCSGGRDPNLPVAVGLTLVLLAGAGVCAVLDTAYRRVGVAAGAFVALVGVCTLDGAAAAQATAPWWPCLFLVTDGLVASGAATKTSTAAIALSVLWITLRFVDESADIGVRAAFKGDVGLRDATVRGMWGLGDGALCVGVFVLDHIITRTMSRQVTVFPVVEQLVLLLSRYDLEAAQELIDRSDLPHELGLVVHRLMKTMRKARAFLPTLLLPPRQQEEPSQAISREGTGAWTTLTSSVTSQDLPPGSPRSANRHLRAGSLRVERAVVVCVGVQTMLESLDDDTAARLSSTSERVLASIFDAMDAAGGCIINIEPLACVAHFPAALLASAVATTTALVQGAQCAGSSFSSVDGVDMAAAVEHDAILSGLVGTPDRRAFVLCGAPVVNCMRAASTAAGQGVRIGHRAFGEIFERPGEGVLWQESERVPGVVGRRRAAADQLAGDLSLTSVLAGRQATQTTEPMMMASPVLPPSVDDRCFSWLFGLPSIVSSAPSCEAASSKWDSTTQAGTSRSDSSSVLTLAQVLDTLGMRSIEQRLHTEGIEDPAVLAVLSDAELRDLGFGYGHIVRLRGAFTGRPSVRPRMRASTQTSSKIRPSLGSRSSRSLPRSSAASQLTSEHPAVPMHDDDADASSGTEAGSVLASRLGISIQEHSPVTSPLRKATATSPLATHNPLSPRLLDVPSSFA